MSRTRRRWGQEGAVGTVYLIHFREPYKQAQHYLGWAKRYRRRIAHHRNGSGARLVQVVNAAGIDWRVVRAWKGTRNDEKRLKGWNNGRRLCPICAEERGWRVVHPQLEEVVI